MNDSWLARVREINAELAELAQRINTLSAERRKLLAELADGNRSQRAIGRATGIDGTRVGQIIRQQKGDPS
jgi:hypothetical protein